MAPTRRLQTVMDARPDILNHNLETVKRLQKPVRKRARWDRSLYVLGGPRRWPSRSATRSTRRSSLMVGLGETRDELTEAFEALRAVDVDILTVGQYLRPSLQHLPLERYYHPDEFAEMKAEALALGFKHVESAPLVRSSYHARDQVPGAELKRGAAARRPSTPTAASSRHARRLTMDRSSIDRNARHSSDSAGRSRISRRLASLCRRGRAGVGRVGVAARALRRSGTAFVTIALARRRVAKWAFDARPMLARTALDRSSLRRPNGSRLVAGRSRDLTVAPRSRSPRPKR